LQHNQFDDSIVEESCLLLSALSQAINDPLFMALCHQPLMEALPLHSHDPRITKLIGDLAATYPVEEGAA